MTAEGGVGAVTSRKPRILLVHERYQQAGGEEGVFETQRRVLEAHGHDVATLEVHNDDIDTSGLTARLALARDTIWSRDGAARVARAIDTFRPDVLHAHNTFPMLSPAVHTAARARGVATVQTLHNYRLVCPSAVVFRDGHPCVDCVGLPVALPGVVHGCYRDSRAATAIVATMETVHRARGTWRRDVDRLVVLGRFARDLLVRGGIPPRRMTIVPNAVDPSTAPPSAAITGSGYLFVGRLTDDKGVRTMLQAWATVPGDITLTIAGTGPLEGEVRRAAGTDPRIRYVGRLTRAEVDAALVVSRALLVPSTFLEVCPLSVLEAFANGRGVIGSGHGGIADLVNDGTTGRFVVPGDASDLARIVSESEADPAALDRMGRAALADYQDRFTPERWYEALRSVYEGVLRERAGERASS